MHFGCDLDSCPEGGLVVCVCEREIVWSKQQRRGKKVSESMREDDNEVIERCQKIRYTQGIQYTSPTIPYALKCLATHTLKTALPIPGNYHSMSLKSYSRDGIRGKYIVC